MSASLIAPVRRPFRALAAVFIPETAQADEPTWLRLEEIVSDALAARPPALQRQVLLFVRILDSLSLVRRGHRLASLNEEKRRSLVEGIASSRSLLLRRGVWGLRTLVQMGWYAQPTVQQSLGYRADRSGWEVRG